MRYTIFKLNIQNFTSQILAIFEYSIFKIFSQHSNDFDLQNFSFGKEFCFVPALLSRAQLSNTEENYVPHGQFQQVAINLSYTKRNMVR